MDELPFSATLEPSLGSWQALYHKTKYRTALSGSGLAAFFANQHRLSFEANPVANPCSKLRQALPKTLLTRYPTIVLENTQDDNLRLAVFYPYPEEFLRHWCFFSKRHCQAVVISKEQWDRLWQAEQRQETIRTFQENETPDEQVIVWLESMLSESIRQHGSDLHFEPQQNAYRVRLRIDGRLCTVQNLPQDLAHRVISRIKILANLDIAERRLPQDGGFQLEIEQKTVHFRISTCPVMDGEKLVIRILDKKLTALELVNLGMPPDMLCRYQRILNKPQGMILVTGPTGSGKSITLYASLSALNHGDYNIATIEDPVEMQIAGLNQVRVNLKAGLDFANTLRALLRQDPDIIMVGEIRDHITADIAVRAAQTGHLLLSTVHSNSAAETLIRLINMGIPAYQLCSALRCIIAQRLLRRLCAHCKYSVRLETHTTGLKTPIDAFDASGCEQCHGGYRGRLAVFEYLEMNDTLESLFLQHPSMPTLKNYMREQKIARLSDAALLALTKGETSWSEILRLIDMDEL